MPDTVSSSVLNVTVVFNPSKVENPAAKKQAILNSLQRYNPKSINWLETSLDDPGTNLCMAALKEGTDLVLAYGGDGTIRACATALTGSEVPLAVLPAGTGNLLATHFSLPTPLDEAIDVAFLGDRVKIDVGWCNGQAFLVMAGMGFDAEMVQGTSPLVKRYAGWVAYPLASVKPMLSKRTTFTVKADNIISSHRGQGVFIANVGSLQGGMKLLPAASPTDGLLDVAVLTPKNLFQWAKFGVSLLSKSHRHGGNLKLLQGTKVTIFSKRPILYQLDGDIFHLVEKLDFEVKPAALTLVCPKSKL